MGIVTLVCIYICGNIFFYERTLLQGDWSLDKDYLLCVAGLGSSANLLKIDAEMARTIYYLAHFMPTLITCLRDFLLAYLLLTSFQQI